MIDIHSHIIPNIDDGSNRIEESYEMLKKANNAGFTEIITTSHYIEGTYITNSNAKNAILEKLNQFAKENSINMQLHNGSEIYITLNMVNLLEQKEASTLANSKYVLFELPMNNNVIYLDECIFELKSKGYIPIIAHPERYRIVQQDFKIVTEWINKGAYMQCNYMSIIGNYGNMAKKTVKNLLKNNLVHLLGSDAHNIEGYSHIKKCVKKIQKYIGKDRFEQISTINPLHIIKNEDIW